MTTSIIIVSYHTGPVLWLCLDAALRQTGVEEVILVNNGNPAMVTAQLHQIATLQPKLKLVDDLGNIGFAAGCNRAAAMATGETFILLNPDCVLPAGGASMLAEALAAHPHIWLMGCQLVNADGSLQATARRNFLTLATAASETLGLHRFSERWPGLNRPQAVEEDMVEVPAVSGALMAIPATRYRDLGGMDERYFLHVEDLDLCQRVWQAGGAVASLTKLHVVHYLSTSRVPSTFVERMKLRSFRLYFQKHFGGTLRLWQKAALHAGLLARYLLRWGVSRVQRFRPRPMGENIGILRQLALRDAPVVEDNGQTVVLTGATGLLGLRTASTLLGKGYRVVGLTRGQPVSVPHPHLEWLRGDLQHQPLRYLSGRTHILVHTAGLWLLPDHLRDFADHGGKRVIAFSSTSVITKAESPDAKERAMAQHLAWAEAETRHLCEEYGLELTLLRPTMIYGYGLDHNISRMARLIRRFKAFPIIKWADGLRQPVHVDDLALAVVRVLENPATIGNTYSLGGGETLPYGEMICRIFDILHLPRRLIAVPGLPFLMNAARWCTGQREGGGVAHRMRQDQAFDNTAAIRDFSYAPRPFLSGGVMDLGAFVAYK